MVLFHVLILALGVLLSWAIAAELFRELLKKAFKGAVRRSSRPVSADGALDYAPPENKSAWLQRHLWLPSSVVVLFVAVAWLPLVLIGLAGQQAIGVHSYMSDTWTWGLTCLVIATAGGIVIVRRGLRRDLYRIPAAANWRGMRLWLAIAGCFAAITVVALVADRVVSGRLDAQRAWAQARTRELVGGEGDRAAGALYEDAQVIVDQKEEAMAWMNELDAPPEPSPFPQELEGAVAATLKASAAEKPDFGVDRTVNVTLQKMPHLARLRTLATLVGWHAVDRARGGDWAAAVAEIRAIQKMARQCDQGASLVESLVALGLDGLAMAKMEECLSFARTQEDLDALTLTEPAWYGDWARRAVACDEADTRWLMADVLQGRIDPGAISPGLRVGAQFSPMRLYLGAAELEDLDRLYAAARAGAMRVEDEVAPQPTMPAVQMRGMLVRLMGPSMNRPLQAVIDSRAMRQNLELAIAVTRHRLHSGELPRSLEQLVEAGLVERVPTDPWDGKPWKFVNKGDHVVIYSVGRDRQDDGGVDDRPLKAVDTLMRVSDRPIWEFEPQTEVEPGSNSTGDE